jgi:signal transduction histidine kinase
MKRLVHDARNHVWNLAGLGQLLAQSSRHPNAELFMRCVQNEAMQVVHLLESLCFAGQGEDADEEEVAFDAREHLSVVVNGLVPLAKQAGIELRLEAPGACAAVLGKPRMLNRLLANLIRNAIIHAQATQVSASLDCALTCSPTRVTLTYEVRDDGVGIHAPEASTARGGAIGSGHGLPICFELAARMKAVLTLGRGPGGGTKARVEMIAQAREFAPSVESDHR